MAEQKPTLAKQAIRKMKEESIEDPNIFELPDEDPVERPLSWGESIKLLSDIWVELRNKELLCTQWENNHLKFREVVGVPRNSRDRLRRIDIKRKMSPNNFEWSRE